MTPTSDKSTISNYPLGQKIGTGDVDLPRVQARLLEMGKAIAAVLERNGVPYMITFGTLLGAVRHGGFIPWDDDFDFFLFDDSYDRGIEVLRKELSENVFVEDEKSEPIYFHGWSHIKDLRSEVHHSQFPHDALYAHHGLSVDLYRCKRMLLRDLRKYRREEARAYLERKQMRGMLLEKDALAKWAELAKQIDSEEAGNEWSSEPVLGMAVKERYMRCADVFPLKSYQFGSTTFWGPKNADAVLRHFYGDYMRLPCSENRMPHYDWVEFKN